MMKRYIFVKVEEFLLSHHMRYCRYRNMKKWTRARYMPNLPLEGHERKVTASPEHLELARRAGCEGMVLLKNEDQILPLHPD